jgi:hypothetical protein
MKSFILTITSLLLGSIIASAQQISITEKIVPFRKENYNALIANVYSTKLKDVEKEFESFISSYQGKASKKKGIIIGEGVIIPSVTHNSMTIYAKVEELQKNENIQLSVAFDLGTGMISSINYPEQYQRTQQILREFAISLTDRSHAATVKEKEKGLDKEKKQYEKLVEKREKVKNENAKYEDKISKNQVKIDKYDQDIDAKQKELNNFKSSLDRIKQDNKITY